MELIWWGGEQKINKRVKKLKNSVSGVDECSGGNK